MPPGALGRSRSDCRRLSQRSRPRLRAAVLCDAHGDESHV